MDRETNTFADYRKVRTIDFEGKYFKSRGPLNTVPSPQHRPAFLQAGASPRGRAFAAGAADAIIAVGTGIEGMKEYRDDIRARAEAAGRNPDDIKLLFVVSPTIAATEAEAIAEAQRTVNDPSYIDKALVGISSNTEIDFKQFDLDEPLPEGLTTNGERGSLEHFMRGDGTPGPKTLRQLTIDWATTDDLDEEMRCRCGSPSCRGTISGKDWMKPALQEKYRGWFCWFLQRKIDAAGR